MRHACSNTITPDHPRIRNLQVCPKCAQHKERGLVVCWPCHRDLKRVYGGGYGPFEETLDVVEAHLMRKAYEPKRAPRKIILNKEATEQLLELFR